MKTRFRIGRIGRAVLVVLIGLGSTGQYQVRNRHVFRAVTRQLGDLREWEYRRTAKRLASHGLVALNHSGEIDEVSLLGAGRTAAAVRGIGVGPVPADPAAKLRVVSYDVPETQRSRRRLLREGLRAIGFEPIQQSLYAHRANCAREVANLSASLGVEHRIEIFVSAD